MNTTDAASFSFTNTQLGNLPISRISVEVNVLVSSVQNTIMGITFNSPSTSSEGIPFMIFQCQPQPSLINVTFADNGEPVSDNCDNLGEGKVLQAYTNMEETIKQLGVTFATPIYFVVANPPDGVFFFSATMTLCTVAEATLYSANLAKFNLNVFGFEKSQDSFHSTSIFYDANGKMLYVTISVPIDSVTCLK